MEPKQSALRSWLAAAIAYTLLVALLAWDAIGVTLCARAVGRAAQATWYVCEAVCPRSRTVDEARMWAFFVLESERYQLRSQDMADPRQSEKWARRQMKTRRENAGPAKGDI